MKQKKDDIAKGVGSSGKSPWDSIGAQLYVDIKTRTDTTKFCKISDGIFGLKEITYSLEERRNW